MYYKIMRQLLAQIKNACNTKKSTITINYSINVGLVLNFLKNSGFIRGSQLIFTHKYPKVKVYLKFDKFHQPCINSIRNISRTLQASPITSENKNLLYRNFNVVALNGINKFNKVQNTKCLTFKSNQAIFLLK
jgi:ribosomal protein S8|mmetsp:Transcript_11481/g.31724  ORF Transcript_11481/g.31724 Transcript_11481/m.31724 type:complete len:133 (+) Transcript_11481:15-413(+)